jgi:membrane associated rhomboid family serine protease
VLGLLILFAVVAFFVYRAAKPEEREKYFGMVTDRVAGLKAAVLAPRPEADAFRAALRARSRYLVVTPAIAALNAIVFAGILFGTSSAADPGTLLGWGASLGTQTTNGEWWRLLTSLFVHDSLFYLLVSIAVLVQLGAIVERVAGRAAFALVYILAGVIAGMVRLSAHPVDVLAGSTGALFGLYGLLVAIIACQLVFQRRAAPEERDAEPSGDPNAEPPADPSAEQPVDPVARIPYIAMKRLAIIVVLFIGYLLVSGRASNAEPAALVVGLAFGLGVLVSRSGEQQPSRSRIAIAAAVTAVIAVVYAVPLRNISDVKPEIARLIASERQSADAYQSSLDAYKKGRATGDAVAQLAERTFMPELHAADARLVAFANVPAEHRPLVADAREYIRLRYDSWRLRAAALRTNTVPRRDPNSPQDASWRLQAEKRFRSNLAASGKAEAAERAALEAFQQLASRPELTATDK